VTDSTFLTEANGFRYSVATPRWRDPMLRVLSEAFCREPMAASLGATPEQMARFIGLFVDECASNGLSAVATPAEDPETLAGVFICRDFKAPIPDGIEQNEMLMPAMTALMTVDEEYERTRPGLQPGDAVDLWMVGVDAPRFAGKGISNVLFDLCPGLAKQQGYGLCVTECTGHFSQSAARRAGFREAARLAYSDFRFDGQPLFAGIPAPHTHLLVLEKEL
jgi:hypothetical protein